MNSQRIGTHLISTVLLLLWGGILLYYHWNGRIMKYLTEDGFFRPMALWGGIGMIVLALYNLATIGAKEAACCEHDHDHNHDHDHKHDHDHSHAHKEGCCGHDHGHEHAHSHAHEHEHGHAHKEGECCGHSHAAPQSLEHAHVHEHEKSCCGHDHGHEHHHHDHDHGHEDRPPGHAHGILEESGSIGRWVAIFLLAVPVAFAAIKSPDGYSQEYILKKDKQKYGRGGKSERFQKGVADPSVAAVSPAPTPAPSPASAPVTAPPSTPPSTPGTKVQDQPPGVVPPPVNPKEVERQATKTAEAKSYGSFTLADLKAQVPQSPEGNFMLEVPELFYTAGDKEVQAVLDGQPVETIAQVLPEKVNNEDGSRVRIFRLQVQCCAADARPFSIPVEFGKAAPAFKDMTWVKVTGKMTYQKEGEQVVPVLEATSMTETAEPANSMVY